MADDQLPADGRDPRFGPAAEPGTTTCYRHPERPTGLRCSRCNRPICGECARPAPVGQLCPDDAGDRVRVRGLASQRRPVVTFSLLGVNTLLLLVTAAQSGNGVSGLLTPTSAALCRLGALNAPAIAQSGQWWRLFTVMVLHAGLIHFLFNSYALYAFGPMLEMTLGGPRFLALYVGSGFVGAAASFGLHHTALSVGASGAIFGLLGALVAFFWRRRHAGGQAPFQNLLLIMALNLFLTFRLASIDSLAHVGGLVAGMGTMALLDAVPARQRNLGTLVLAAPFLLGVVLTLYGIATFPADAGLPSCVGV
ncbi:MAG TPA: rhomboid family intramembrane serine protease [Actinomycetes bacterium]